MEVLTFLSKCPDVLKQFSHAPFRGTDRRTIFTARISTRLARVKPELNGPGQYSISNIPEISRLWIVRQPVTQLHNLFK